MPQCHFTGKNVWILKPTSMNRGQGIHVANTFKKIKKLIRDYCRGREITDQAHPSTSTANNTTCGVYLYAQMMALNESQAYGFGKDVK